MYYDENKRNIILIGLYLALFFASLDQTVVGTAMPRIIGELGGLSIMTWVTTAYMLTSTTIVPIAGKLSDLFGRRVVYITGLVIFMSGSALCGTSTTMLQLIVYRSIQGIGGGIMMPLAMTIVGDIFSPAERGKWQGLMGALFGLSSVIGPTIGGWIVDYSSWQWVFYINLPIGILATLTIYLGLRGEKRPTGHIVIDYAGIVTLIFGTVGLLLGLNFGGIEYPWLSWQIAGLFITSIISWLVFIQVEKKAVNPILSLELFKNRIFAVTNVIGFLMGLGMFGSLMFLPLFFQGVLGISATNSGNIMLPMMLSMMVTSAVAGRLSTRIPFRSLYVAGMTLMAAAFYLLSTMTADTIQLTAVGYMVILGIGMGIIMPVLTIAVQSAFGAEKRGVATSATQFFRSIGGTFGMAILGIIFNDYSRNIMRKDFSQATQNLPAGIQSSLSSMLNQAQDDPHSLFNVLLSPDAIAMIPTNSQQMLLPLLKTALAESLHIVFRTAMMIAIMGIFISLLIGKAKLERKRDSKQGNDTGMTLFAEGIPEVELASELVPDLIEGTHLASSDKNGRQNK